MKTSAILLVTAALCLGPAARAGVVTGRVVDANGSGVAGVNIDVRNPSGSDPSTTNAGTDAGGFFAVTVVPDGVYDFVFEPPPPPQTTHLVREVEGFVVVGTRAMGTVVLPPGVALSGRVLSPTGAAVAGADLDVIELASGQGVALVGDFTNSFGQFQIAVPAGGLELRVDPSGLVGPTLAPDARELAPSGNTNLGDLRLSPGFIVSAIVKRLSNGAGVDGCDVDVYDSATGRKLFTPGDDSDPAGFVDFVVPAGTYDIELCPPFAARLVAGVLRGQAVAANRYLGQQFLQSGVVLSGTVLAYDGTPHARVDVDVTRASDGWKVPLCNDDTDASGRYAVVVPTGTFHVQFTPPYSLPLGSQTRPSVAIGADRTLAGTLPSCPFFTTAGSGTPGTGGLVPDLAASGGAPRLGNPDWALEVSRGRGGAQALLRLAFERPGAGGLPMRPRPLAISIPVVLSGPAGAAGAGAASVPLPIRHHPALAGVTLHARVLVADPQASNGTSKSHELLATYCP